MQSNILFFNSPKKTEVNSLIVIQEFLKKYFRCTFEQMKY